MGIFEKVEKAGVKKKTKIGQKIGEAAKNIGNTVVDAVDNSGNLGRKQKVRIEELVKEHKAILPEPDGEEALDEISGYIASCGVEIYNAHLNQLNNLYIPLADETDENLPEGFNPNHNIRFINITRWVTDKDENSLEKLINVYEVLTNEYCNIALVFNRTPETVNVYMAVSNIENKFDNVSIKSYKKRVEKAIKGNFPGSEWSKKQGIGTLPCFDENKSYSVAVTSNIPTEKSEKFVSQTIEKLLDGIIPENKKQEYTIVLLATPVHNLEDRKTRLSGIYSSLTPYASWQKSYQYNKSDAIGASGTVGLNLGASKGSGSFSSHTDGVTQMTGKSTTVDVGKIAGKAGGLLGTVVGSIFPGVGTVLGRTIGSAVGSFLGSGISKGKTESESFTSSDTSGSSANRGGNFGLNFARTASTTATVGEGESVTQNFMNHSVKHALEMLDKQMERYEMCASLGMWDFAAYILSEDFDIANNVAHTYVALTEGEESYLSSSPVNMWRGDTREQRLEAQAICDYIFKLRHPIFVVHEDSVKNNPQFECYPWIVTATTALSGKELAYSLNFPKKSVPGLAVMECAEFGRNIVTYDIQKYYNKIKLGNIFHMNHSENTDVSLSLNSLASHTFVTGSTGAGKSNAVYKIIEEARKHGIKFLVVEPAKGEYKDVFGNDPDVKVFGTNPDKAPLLRINPFNFPSETHILEHLDRLIEIFNVCWPMYAAMPAVLKNAVEKAYEDCGWNLITSRNKYGDNLFPTFADVARNVKSIIDSSEYDNENKGAYKGSLLTRLHSLTNGINGLIFTNDEVDDKDFFDENVIVDISRVGSSETKSLIMGILILELQEYRMATREGANCDLKHITVLEEAHNILRRTSAESSSESGNLTGKSVEMISNAIAEMRTYGEGFVIADQAPGLLDMAAIRNTNTKIIMRLPDQGDRELVGRAANLNDNQIIELAKLPRGVAAVYQNEWIQPILCMIDKYESDENVRYNYVPDNNYSDRNDNYEAQIYIAEILSKGTYISDKSQLKDIMDKMKSIHLSASNTVSAIKLITTPSSSTRITKLAPIMSELFPSVAEAVKSSYNDVRNTVDWTESAEKALSCILKENTDAVIRRTIIKSIITNYILLELNDQQAMKDWIKRSGLR